MHLRSDGAPKLGPISPFRCKAYGARAFLYSKTILLIMNNLIHLIVILTSLSFIAIENASAIEEKMSLGEYNISFSMNTSSVLTKECHGPLQENGVTIYACELKKSPGQKFGPGILQFEEDVTSALLRNASDHNTRLWLSGLAWQRQEDISIVPSVTGWRASSWLDNKTMLVFTGNILEEEVSRIFETLSVKRNGIEIYDVNETSLS